MSNMVKNLVALVAMICMVMGMTSGFEGDAFGTDGGDLGTPFLVASVIGNAFSLDNVGTTPSVDCGGAKILVGNELVGILPYVTVLAPNPFIFTKDVPMAPKWSQKVELTRVLMPGEKFVVTNGVGIYAQGVAA